MANDYKSLAAGLDAEGVKYTFDEPMAGRCSFRAGGRAAMFVSPDGRDGFFAAYRLALRSGLPFFVLGRGTNVLVGDGGYDGVVISSAPSLGGIDVAPGALLVAGAGVPNAIAASIASARSLAGFEFAAGIPGTVGGGLRMNAGAYGGEYAGIVEWCDYLGPDGALRRITNAELEFGYRRSFFTEHTDCVAVTCAFRLRAGVRAEIDALVSELAARRKKSQPLEYPSAGSTFKRPEGRYAGQLIESAGLKGRRVGGAVVSEKHAGFIVNDGGASARDIAELVRVVQDEVLRVHGVALEREVIFLGKF